MASTPRSPRVPRYLLDHARKKQEQVEWKASRDAAAVPPRRRAPSPDAKGASGRTSSGSKHRDAGMDALFGGLFDDDIFSVGNGKGTKEKNDGKKDVKTAKGGKRGDLDHSGDDDDLRAKKGGNGQRPQSASPTRAHGSSPQSLNKKESSPHGVVHVDSRPASQTPHRGRTRAHGARGSESNSANDSYSSDTSDSGDDRASSRKAARAVARASPTIRKTHQKPRFQESADEEEDRKWTARKLSDVMRAVRDATGHLSDSETVSGALRASLQARRSPSPTHRRSVRAVRLNVYRNGAADHGGVAVTARTHEEFLQEARRRLELNADIRRVFVLDGREVGNVCKLKTHTDVVVSLGEDYNGPSSLVVDSVSGLDTNDGPRPHTRRHRKPLAKSLTSSVRRLSSKKRARLLILRNGKYDESHLTVARFGVEQFLTECTEKLGLSKPAQWFFAFDGIEVEDPSDTCPAEEDVWASVVGGRPLWVSCGEPFDPAGPRAFVRYVVGGLRERESALKVGAAAAANEEEAAAIALSLAEIAATVKALNKLGRRIPKEKALEAAEMIPAIARSSRVLSEKRAFRVFVRKDGDAPPAAMSELRPKSAAAARTADSKGVKQDTKGATKQTRPQTAGAARGRGGDDAGVVDGSKLTATRQPKPKPRGTPVMIELMPGAIKDLVAKVVDVCDGALRLGGRAKRVFDASSNTEIKDPWIELRNDMEIIVSCGEALKAVQVHVVGISSYTTIEVPFPSKPPPPPRKGQTARPSTESGGPPSVCPITAAQKKIGERGAESQRWLFRQDGAIASIPDPNVFMCGFRKAPKTYVPVAIHRNELLRLSNPDMAWQWEFTGDGTIRLVRQDDTVVLTIAEPPPGDFGAQFSGDMALSIEAPRPNDPRQRWGIRPDDADIAPNLLQASKRARERAKHSTFDSDEYITSVRPTLQWEKQGLVWPRHSSGEPLCNSGFDIVGTLIARAPPMLTKGGDAATETRDRASALSGSAGIPLLVTRPGESVDRAVVVIAKINTSTVKQESEDESDSDDSSDYGFNYRTEKADRTTNPETPKDLKKSVAAMNAFLDSCTRALALPSAARRIYLPSGEEVTSLSGIERNTHVVVSVATDPALVRSLRPQTPARSSAFARRKTDCDIIKRYFAALDDLSTSVYLEGSSGGSVGVVSEEGAAAAAYEYGRDSRRVSHRPDGQRWTMENDRLFCREQESLALCARDARPRSGCLVVLSKPHNAADGCWSWDNGRLVSKANPLLALSIMQAKGGAGVIVGLELLAEPATPSQLWSLDPSSGALVGFAGTLWQKEFAAALKAGMCTAAVDREGNGHRQSAFMCDTCSEDRRRRRERRRKVRTLHKLETTRGAGKGTKAAKVKKARKDDDDSSNSDDSEQEESAAVPGDSGSSYGSGDEGFMEPTLCESCARTCHNGHRLRRLPKARRFSCDCVRSRGSRRRCLCLGEEEFKVLVENKDSLLEMMERKADRLRSSPDKSLVAATLNPPESVELATARLYRGYAAGSVRVRVFKNDGRADKRESQVISAKTLEELLDEATRKLGMPSAVRRLFGEDGAEITDLRGLTGDGDNRDPVSAYASCGEKFLDPRDIEEVRRLRVSIDREQARLKDEEAKLDSSVTRDDDDDNAGSPGKEKSAEETRRRSAVEQGWDRVEDLKSRLKGLTLKLAPKKKSKTAVHPQSGRFISVDAAKDIEEGPQPVVRLSVRDVDRPDVSALVTARDYERFLDDVTSRLQMHTAVRSVYTPEGYRLRTFADLQQLSKDSTVWVSGKKTLANAEF